MTDRQKICDACQRVFVISPSEALFYAERGLQEPTYCPECRQRRRADRHLALLATAGQINGGALLGTYGGFAPPAARGTDGSTRFTAVCSSCGGEAIVPFQPRPGRPVYCRRCFGARKGR